MPRVLHAACPFCGEGGSNRVCKSCRPSVYLDGVSALSAYADSVVQRAIRTWKYHFDRHVEVVLKRWFLQNARRLHLPDAECISPVPLHPHRLRARGFDQADWLAQRVGEHCARPVRELLTRRRKTRVQARRARKERKLGMLDGSFISLKKLQTDTVILCDDVFTSGATMDAAAKALKDAGVRRVWGCVIARGK